MSPRVDTEVLLAHAGWVRALARRLVSDPHVADDAAQDTLVAALERPPRADGVRGWLATVLRHRLGRARSEAAGRARREAECAQSEEVASAHDAVERASTHRDLVESVLALDEPYRTALLLRYFDELPPREIAARLDVPVATVNSRLARGLQQLRSKLEREHGPRLHGLLIGLAHLPSPTTPPLLPVEPNVATAASHSSLGALIVSTKSIALLVLLTLGGTLVAALALHRDGPAAPERVPAHAATLAELPAPAPQSLYGGTQPAALPAERAPLSPPVAQAPRPGAEPKLVEPVPPAELHEVRGRVLDAEARPVAGIPIWFEGDAEHIELWSGTGGWFEFETRETQGNLSAASEEWATVSPGLVRARSTVDPVLVVAPAVRLAGTVSDEFGRALVGVRVSLELPETFHTRFTQLMEASRTSDWVAFSLGEDGAGEAEPVGSFALDCVPAVADARLYVAKEGYEAVSEPAPLVSTANLTLVLHRPETPAHGSVSGRVVDERGAAVPAARVALGLTTALTDEAGDFTLDLARAVTAHALIAAKPGHLPARLEREELGGEWPEFALLTLGGPPLSIAGRVVDDEGEPRRGVKVWIADGTFFGVIGKAPMELEAIAAGMEVWPEAVASIRELPASDGNGNFSTTTNGVPPSAFWGYVETDAEGRFVLGGLAPRSYHVQATNPDDLVSVTSGPLRAGETSVELRLPSAELHDVEGRVVARDGQPLAGVAVQARRRLYRREARVFGGTSRITIVEAGQETRTDEEGRFALRGLPRTGIELTLNSDEIVPSAYELLDADRFGAVEVVVDTRCHLEVRLHGSLAEEADAIAMRAEDGTGIELLRIRGGSILSQSHAPLEGGRSGVLSVSSAARELLILHRGEVLKRVPVFLRHGEVNLIEP